MLAMAFCHQLSKEVVLTQSHDPCLMVHWSLQVMKAVLDADTEASLNDRSGHAMTSVLTLPPTAMQTLYTGTNGHREHGT